MLVDLDVVEVAPHAPCLLQKCVGPDDVSLKKVLQAAGVGGEDMRARALARAQAAGVGGEDMRARAQARAQARAKLGLGQQTYKPAPPRSELAGRI